MTRRAGLWLSNGAPSDAALMYSWRPGMVTCIYDHLSANQVPQYLAAHPDVQLVVRFMHPTNWHEDIGGSAYRYGAEVAQKCLEIQQLKPWVYFWNELNLHYENGDPDPGHQHVYQAPGWYAKIAEWTERVCSRVQALAPDIELLMPPFAFGHSEDGTPDDSGNPKEGWAGYDYFKDMIKTRFKGRVCGHYYWGDSGGSHREWLYDAEQSSWYAFRWRRVLKMFKTRYGIDASIIIDECGSMAASDQDFTDQVLYYSQQCLEDARVVGMTFFLWEDPTNSPGNLPNAWVQRCRDLAGHVDRLGRMADGGLTPTPDDDTIRVRLANGQLVTLPIEEYLRGVVAAEMPALWPMEAVRAQAVLARSYALRRMADSRAIGAPFDVTSGTSDQVYNPAKVHPASDAAIVATAGVHLHQGGNDFLSQYVSLCGRDECMRCQGKPGFATGSNPGGVWLNRACQYGMKALADAGYDWRNIARYYYPSEVTFSDDTVGGGDNTMSVFLAPDARIPENLRAHKFVDGKVMGSVVRIVDAADAWKRWGNPAPIANGAVYWKVNSCVFLNEDAAGGNVGIYLNYVDENGAPVPGMQMWLAWPSNSLEAPNWIGQFHCGSGGNGEGHVYPDGSGTVTMGGGNFTGITDGSTVVGPYCVAAAQDGPSEVAAGFGLPNNRHVSYAVQFKRARWGTVTPTPDPEPDPMPEPGVTNWSKLAAALRAAADMLDS